MPTVSEAAIAPERLDIREGARHPLNSVVEGEGS
jgi:hypothetical protein